MCCGPFANRHPFQRAHFAAEKGQSNLFERIGFGTSTVDPAEVVDQLLELGEVDERDVVDRIPVSCRIVLTASRGPPNWYAALIFCVP